MTIPPPPPKTALGFHRLLVPSAPVRVRLLSAGFMPQGPQRVSFLYGLGHFDYVEAQSVIKPQK